MRSTLHEISGRLLADSAPFLVSKRLVHLMGGELWVTSQFGRGSQFYFTIQWYARNLYLLPPVPAFPDPYSLTFSRIGEWNLDQVRQKTLIPHPGRRILFIDTLNHDPSITESVEQLGLGEPRSRQGASIRRRTGTNDFLYYNRNYGGR